jgi:hypothetical protein
MKHAVGCTALWSMAKGAKRYDIMQLLINNDAHLEVDMPPMLSKEQSLPVIIVKDDGPKFIAKLDIVLSSFLDSKTLLNKKFYQQLLESLKAMMSSFNQDTLISRNMLFSACCSTHVPDMLECLVQSDYQVNYPNTLLHAVVANCDDKLIQTLCHRGADPNTQNCHGMLPLEVALNRQTLFPSLQTIKCMLPNIEHFKVGMLNKMRRKWDHEFSNVFRYLIKCRRRKDIQCNGFVATDTSVKLSFSVNGILMKVDAEHKVWSCLLIEVGCTVSCTNSAFKMPKDVHLY